MKKVLFSALAVLTAVSIANAEPKFGLIGYTTGGSNNGTAGVFATDDVWNASLTLGTSTTDNSSDNASTDLGIAANYKMAVDSTTALTAGIAYRTTSGKTAGADIKQNNRLDLNVGVEKFLASNVVLTADAAIYTTESTADGSTDDKAKLLNGVKLGVAYLFN